MELEADGSTGPSEVGGGLGPLRRRRRRRWPSGAGRRGMDAAVSSTIPLGVGLSSSAALEVALALALCDVAWFELPQLELAVACQEAEQVATGVPRAGSWIS